jgi:glycosyltransferase involved in cell wall biosynthesis
MRAPAVDSESRATAAGGEAVSVVIPTRNRPALLAAAVRSVLAQTSPVSQILVIDDASDGAEWLPKIAALSPLVEIVRREQNGGPSVARNDGLDRVRGDFVFFLDDDDLLEPGFVEAGLAALAGRPEADGIFFRYRTIRLTEPPDEFEGGLHSATGGKHRWGGLALADAENPAPRAAVEQRPISAFLRYLIPIHSGFVRRTALGAARFPVHLRQGEDTYFWISLVATGRRFVLDDRVYAIVRRHDGNTTCSRARYWAEIPPCYEKLIADGLLTDTADLFLAHLKLLWFKTLTGGKGTRAHLEHVFASPRQFAAEFGFWTVSLAARWLRCRRDLLG